MEITDLYRRYFQKSKVFLFPNLGIKSTAFIVPENTFISWGDLIDKHDEKLIVVYKQQHNEGFRTFEKNVIFKNKYFLDVIECEDGFIAYVFTFAEHSQDWVNFLHGKYSQLSPDLKTKIKYYFGVNSEEYAYIESYLFPTRFFEKYAKMLTTRDVDFHVMHNILQEIGELCTPYSPDIENLKIKVKSIGELK